MNDDARRATEARLREADRIGYALTDINVQLRRIGDLLAQIANASSTATTPATPRAENGARTRLARGDELRRRTTTPRPRRCADCGQEFTPARGFEKRCEPCFQQGRRASGADSGPEDRADGRTDPPRFGPY